MDIHCLSCKKKTGGSLQLGRTANDKLMLVGNCGKCGRRKTRIVSKRDYEAGQRGEGLLGSLLGLPGGKVPVLGNLPLVGDLLF